MLFTFGHILQLILVHREATNAFGIYSGAQATKSFKHQSHVTLVGLRGTTRLALEVCLTIERKSQNSYNKAFLKKIKKKWSTLLQGLLSFCPFFSQSNFI